MNKSGKGTILGSVGQAPSPYLSSSGRQAGLRCVLLCGSLAAHPSRESSQATIQALARRPRFGWETENGRAEEETGATTSSLYLRRPEPAHIQDLPNVATWSIPRRPMCWTGRSLGKYTSRLPVMSSLGHIETGFDGAKRPRLRSEKGVNVNQPVDISRLTPPSPSAPQPKDP